MFTAFCILNILKYKLHLYYCFKQESAPKFVRIAMVALISYTVFLGFYFPLVDCSKSISERAVFRINISFALIYLFLLSGFSLFVAWHLAKQLQLQNCNEIKQRLIALEAVIQTIILVRLLTSIFQYTSYATLSSD